jgi:FOG: Transposase and inactivated derivatives
MKINRSNVLGFAEWYIMINRKTAYFSSLPIFLMTAEQIGQLYKMRWQIELLFKQLKQNFPLKYFLGDNENAIKIQIWCTLIANLLFTIIMRNIKRKISFSMLVSFARQHLFSYNKLTDLIVKTEKEWRKKHSEKPTDQPSLFDG